MANGSYVIVVMFGPDTSNAIARVKPRVARHLERIDGAEKFGAERTNGDGKCCTDGVYLADRSSVRPCERTRRYDSPLVKGMTPPKGSIHPLGTSTSFILKTARLTP